MISTVVAAPIKAVVAALFFYGTFLCMEQLSHDVKLEVGMAVRYYYQVMQEGIQAAEGRYNLLNRLIPQSE